MSIRARTLLFLGAVMAVLVIALHLILSRAVTAGFDRVEQDAARLNLERLREAWQGQVDSLCQKATDWAFWDDSYRFVQDRDPLFVKTNLDAVTTFQGMKIHAILFFDAGGNLIHAGGYDSSRDDLAPVPPPLLERHFAPGSPLLRHAGTDSSHSGLLFTPGVPPVTFCSMPILTTEGEGPIRGSVVFVRNFDQVQQETLAKATRLELQFAPGGDSTSPDGTRVPPGFVPGEPLLLAEGGETRLRGFTSFPDAYGRQQMVASATMDRDIHRQARATLGYMVGALLFLGIVTAGAMALFMDRLLLSRLAVLARQVEEITSSFQFSHRVTQEGRDEFAILAGAVNSLLAAVQQVEHHGVESGIKYHALLDGMPLAAAYVGSAGSPGAGTSLRILEGNRAMAELLGLGPEGMVGAELLPLLGVTAGLPSPAGPPAGTPGTPPGAVTVTAGTVTLTLVPAGPDRYFALAGRRGA
jgi:sensor domain CHASE-containing protein